MSTKREKILQKLNPNLLKMTPKLSGDAGSFIDLDSQDFLEAGAKKLMIRFFKNQDLCEKNKRNEVLPKGELTICSAKYNENNEICDLISERLTLPFINNDEDNLVEKPGRSLQKLQMELQAKMSAKWEKEYKKRVKKNKSKSQSKTRHKKKYSEDENDDDDDDQDDDDGDDDHNELSEKETSNDSNRGAMERFHKDIYDDGDDADVEFENDENDEENNKSDIPSIIKEKQSNASCCEDEDNNCIKDDEYESCSLVPAYQPGGGMLYGGSELTQCEESLPQNLLSPSLSLSINDTSASKTESINEPTPRKTKLCSNEEEGTFTVKTKLFLQNPNDSFDLSDAFEFCSGKFPGENCGSNSSIQNSNEVNVVTTNVVRESNDCNNEYIGIVADTFEEENEFQTLTPEKEVSKIRKNIITFEDSEEENDEIVNDTDLIEPVEEAPKLFSDDENEARISDKIIKKRKHLHFSDEEDATNDCEEGNLNDQLDKSSRTENEDEDDEDDDSEIEGDEGDQRSLHYDSEENEIINPKEFFDKEAELSGSEWSGDEDEKGLDEFDVEEGDADNIDDDQVRSQLEKIHIRRVLDDDAREVRLIQEILFEDGDLHSDGNGRNRKFKWKNLGTFEEQNGENITKRDDGNSSEDDGAEEEALRKLRHEKELFLMAKKKDGDLSSDEEIVENYHAVKVTTVNTSIKISTNHGNKIINAQTITGCNNTGLFSIPRGSFLTRNETFLSKLAKATSGVTDNIMGPKNSKNFIFATKSPEKINQDSNGVGKRQASDTESCSRREKKIKLLSPEIHTGPSILDLLV